MNNRNLLWVVILLSATSPVLAQQVSDPNYNPPIARPAYESGNGPLVAIDSAHHNFHTVDGRYKPFAELLRRDGYRVVGHSKALSSDSLTGVDVLVIANPLHEQNVGDWSLPTPSAFTQYEIAALLTWVEKGGSLFLIADHMPFPGATSDLANAFGAEFSNGYARPGHRRSGKPDSFDYATGFRESAVTRGRSDDEKVSKVTTFGGSAFKLPKDATAVIVFGANSVSRETRKAPGITPDAPKVPIEGWSQGAVMKIGNGRVALFGEAAMFSAQLGSGQPRSKMGMNAPGAEQNHQLLLNVMHWLTRLKGISE
jgi:hypothetical protein